MSSSAVIDSVRSLSDLELAALLCLVSGQHGIISTGRDALDDLEAELQLVGSGVFGLDVNLVRLDETSDVQDVLNQCLRPRAREGGAGHELANVLLLRNLHRASTAVQVQILELIRGRRLQTQGISITAPKLFAVLAVIPEGERLYDGLTDYIAIAHRHSLADGFPNLEEASDPYFDLPVSALDSGSKESYVPGDAATLTAAFPSQHIDTLTSTLQRVEITASIRAYMQHLIVFLRMHRATAAAGGGISPKTTRHLEIISRTLAALHGLPYVTPDLVRLAASKVCRHRLKITAPERERSTQWGTSKETAAEWLKGWDADRVIEDVLHTVDCPP